MSQRIRPQGLTYLKFLKILRIRLEKQKRERGLNNSEKYVLSKVKRILTEIHVLNNSINSILMQQILGKEEFDKMIRGFLK